MPDQEALEVALADLPDVSESESSEVIKDNEQQETSEEAAEQSAKTEDVSQEGETKSQRRRRLRRERETNVNAEVERLRAENERLKTRGRTVKAPNPQDYTNQAEYAADLAAYRVRSQDAQAETERIQSDFKRAETAERDSFAEAAMDFKSEGVEKYPDFAELVSRTPDKGGPALTTVMTEALFESDAGVDVAYYLAKNPAESKKIAQMSPVAQARAVFQLEAKVAKQAEPVRSKAPAPVKPVKGGSAAPQKSPSEMSMSEYAAYRQKQMQGG